MPAKKRESLFFPQLFLQYYVCPEPVLVKRSIDFLVEKRLFFSSKKAFFRTIEGTVWPHAHVSPVAACVQ
jgi:hypothetical protein